MAATISYARVRPGGRMIIVAPMVDHFEEKARDWDERPVPLQISEGVGALLRSLVEWQPTMHIMDFGAGTGLLAGHVAPLVEKVAAVDISPAMLENLAAKPELQGKVEIHCQNILAEPLDESFDGIVSAMAMHHVENIPALLASFNAHLVPGGFVALADLDAEDGGFHTPGTEGVYHRGFDRDVLGEQLRAAGFRNAEFHTALTVTREEGGSAYPVFLVVARK